VRPAALLLACAAGCWSEATVGVIPARPVDAGAKMDVGFDRPTVDAPDAGEELPVDVGTDLVTVDAPDIGEDRPPPCDAGLDRCGGDCVMLETDRNHCGRCGHRCTTSCIEGHCGEEIVDVAIGLVHTCVVRYDGRVYCWGDNFAGQLGDGSYLARFTHEPAMMVADATQVGAGLYHTCALLRSGRVSCWGSNRAGQLGNNSLSDSALPVPVFGIPDAVLITVGLSFSCAVDRSMRTFCWGDNSGGNLGTGDRNDRLTPYPIGTWFDGATELACGQRHTCALRTGRVWCWGEDNDGCLGRGHAGPNALMPEPVPDFDDVREVGTGSSHTCALRREGSVWCWGNNTGGQLGDGTRTDSPSPVQVLGLANIQQLAVAPGQDFSCAVDGESVPWCWGANDAGQLGRGTVSPMGVPGDPARVLVGAWRIVKLRAGARRACGIVAGGRRLLCWGENESGTFGALTPRNSPTPIEVPLPNLP
jgi:alpha-tubulin suppressor-like RCC1 family protein